MNNQKTPNKACSGWWRFCAITQDYPNSTARFDWIVIAFSAWIIGGLYLDGWAHSHGRVDDVFFTPWHAILYSGVLVLFIFLFINQVRNVFKGYPLRRALPKGYLLSLIGLGLFLLGGALDLLWHTLFGVEFDLAALLSPAHLLLATSGVLMVSGPMRAAWARRLSGEASEGWKTLGPVVLSGTFVLSILSILTFFTQFAHPIGYQLVRESASTDQRPISDIYLMNVADALQGTDGTGQMRLTTNPNVDTWGSAWSPEGDQIVFTQREVVEEGESGESALYLMKSDGSEIKQLTQMPGREYLPAWSPDGTRIAFVSQTKQAQDIYVINFAAFGLQGTDGSNVQQLTDTPAEEYAPAWSPDGKQIVYGSSTDRTSQLYLINSDGSHSTPLTSSGNFNGGAAWSPDGQRIAFHSSRSDNTDIYVINFADALQGTDGSGETRLTDTPSDDFSPTWSPDGREIAFVSWENNQSDIYVIDADGSHPRNLTHNHALEINFPEWSPDGKTIMFTANGHAARSNPYTEDGIAVAGIMLQSAFLMGAVLMLIRHWRLPLGALTLMFTLNGALMSVFEDRYALILPMLGAGLIADSLLAWLKPAAERPGRFALFTFSVPVVLYTFYFLALYLTQGVGWVIHLWLGAIFMAGIVGLFVGFLMVSPLKADKTALDL